MTAPEVSVVVPVYGVERFVERCARSLFGQTETDTVEFIFVDDCTPDDSIAIISRVLNDYCALKPQVSILRHDQNRGLPQARKTGIEAARGRYILNVDSDDRLEPDAIETLLAKARETDADIVVCDSFYSTDTHETILHQPVNPETLLTDMIRTKNTWAVWNKLIRRDLYFSPEPIVFPEIYMAEDMFQVYQLVYRADKSRIAYVDAPLYHYRARELRDPQVDPAKTRNEYRMMRDNLEQLLALNIGNPSPRVADWLRMRAKVLLYPLLAIKGGRKEILAAYPELNFRILFNPIAPLRSRLLFLAILCGLPKLAATAKSLQMNLRFSRK